MRALKKQSSFDAVMGHSDNDDTVTPLSSFSEPGDVMKQSIFECSIERL